MLHAKISRLLAQQRPRMDFYSEQPPDGESDRVHRRRHRKRRFYFFRPDAQQRRKWLLAAGMLALGGVFLFSAVSLLSYGLDYLSARQSSSELRALYREETDVTPVPSELPSHSPAPSAAPTTAVALPSASPKAQRLPTVAYPHNPYNIISASFTKLRRQNADIIGWLTIEDLLDEPVVQRDNSYYLRRDYRGYHNTNGAIFLDENISLKTRPYTLLLYGHNMKTGAMFGGLRNYENLAYYKNAPFITFNTLYEDGRYVIFSVATVSTTYGNWRYVNFSRLISPTISLRQKELDTLLLLSAYTHPVPVSPEDQLLLLITCVDNTEERRIIAARRLRDGETEEDLLRLVHQTYAR